MNCKILLTAITGVTLAFLTGCATEKGPTYAEAKTNFVVPQDRGLVILYVHDQPIRRFDVWANNQLVATRLHNDTFTTFPADPGELHISSTGLHGSTNLGVAFALGGVVGVISTANERKNDRIVFPVAPGQTYYVDMHRGFAHEKMDLRTKEEAEKKLNNFRLIEWIGAPTTNSLPQATHQ